MLKLRGILILLIPKDIIEDAVRSLCTKKRKKEEEAQEFTTKILQEKDKTLDRMAKYNQKKREDPEAVVVLECI
jgi:hypothetical protein